MTRKTTRPHLIERATYMVEAAGVELENAGSGNVLTTHDF